jgi:hypothetical protein
MPTTKPTPGPLFVVTQDEHGVARGVGYGIYADCPDTGRTVAEITVDPERPDDPEAAAYARLFAAAPVMFGLLHDAEDGFTPAESKEWARKVRATLTAIERAE